MSGPTRIAIVGYGNVGRGVLSAVEKSGDMSLVGIITRRPSQVLDRIVDDFALEGENLGPLDAMHVDNLIYDAMEDGWMSLRADVAILCGGSKTDLPVQGPDFAKFFNTVDSFDTHDKIPDYFEKMDAVARHNDHTAVISAGWDPGTFSLERVLGSSFIPASNPRGFYGLEESGGLSMGHSDALRRVNGVADARQYTHAITDTMQCLRDDHNLEA